ncbi:uncharacterized protein A1O9_05236 [Exophiala aquamarina CBS 119918]|uniref:Long-chain acyl-CoA synthetase n=1 Tax=Exophiala aquamarina CBS 119918 TaxID=1182545 RepID=A0A072PB62_9EURO|nr:uncharacterized protein A1O9_05236 [Exophiala aquamarina CBS 119918]KEF57319.1 hypothetical protein A1O9_05236 [Exophiala aquamarina CBS 119918]
MSISQAAGQNEAKISSPKKSSFIQGDQSSTLYSAVLANLIDDQAAKNGSHVAAVFSWQNHSITYEQLADRSRLLAKSMLEAGLKHGDTVGIIAGNCYQYIEAFLGAARIGCPFVVFNNTYSAKELTAALAVSSCRLLFMAKNIGHKSLLPHIDTLRSHPESVPELRRIILLSQLRVEDSLGAVEVMGYSTFVNNGHSVFVNNATLRRAEKKVKDTDVLNLQFTSGTTGAPKAAMLTYRNLINNGKLVGDRLNLTSKDRLCCPPPLFHCFGLVMGFLAAFTHSTTIVFPSDQFEPNQVLESLARERCTALYGVPTMFLAEIEANSKKKYKFNSLRVALAAGSPVSPSLVGRVRQELGVEKVLIAYGMTETSPVTFMTSLDDSEEMLFKTVGKIMPHTLAKIINEQGEIVPRGVRGELCTGGYALQKGYWRNEEKTAEAMTTDQKGVRWMHTGDECLINDDGYCVITGRIKDLIIRGGENISPVQVEERLLEHTSIAEASVVGLADAKYGEVVSCFLRLREGVTRPTSDEIVQWVRARLGSHKTPKHIFWIGHPEVGNEYPKTGSGKHQKHILRAIGNRIVRQQELKARL